MLIHDIVKSLIDANNNAKIIADNGITILDFYRIGICTGKIVLQIYENS